MNDGHLNLFGLDLFGDPIRPKVCKLAEDFVVPPFSVLDARAGYWQERKRAWLALGIQSELGRGQNALGREAECVESGLNHYRNADARTFGSGGPGTVQRNWKSSSGNYQQPLRLHLDEGEEAETGTSVFDPVLCELVYRWFCPPGGAVLDPFAGGSVRGIVAAKLGRPYTGVDLRPAQCAANDEQARAIIPNTPPRWVIGFVVGDVRDRSGFYRDLPGATVSAFAAAGMGLYNEAVLVTQVGSLPVRVGGQFPNYRKLGKTHQNVYAFFNGDPTSVKSWVWESGRHPY